MGKYIYAKDLLTKAIIFYVYRLKLIFQLLKWKRAMTQKRYVFLGNVTVAIVEFYRETIGADPHTLFKLIDNGVEGWRYAYPPHTISYKSQVFILSYIIFLEPTMN